MKPRWYQKEAVDKTIEYLEKNRGNPLVVSPTGSGKSLILSLIVRKLVDKERARVAVISHNEEIIKQDYRALTRLLPAEIVGIYSAGLNRKERRTVTVASIQSIYRKAALFSNYDYLVVDEAHLIPHANQGMYHRLINGVKNFNVIGLTATPFRSGTGYLTEGQNALFSSVVFDVPIVRLIKEGYLCGLKTKATNNEMDVSGVATVAGDYSSKDLSKKIDLTGVTADVCGELKKYAEDYKCWLVFAIDIDHANHVNKELNDRGIASTVIHSKLNKEISSANLEEFVNGKYQAAVSVAKLTTGFDHPRIDLIALLRPTKSPVLHIQMIGRGLRVHEDKQHCLILDFAGNIMRLGPINDVHIPIKGKSKKGGQQPVKICTQCNSHVTIQAKSCYYCKYVFPPPPTKLESFSSTLAVVLDSEEKEVGWYAVSRVAYAKYTTRNRVNTMLVSYSIEAGRPVKEYINPFANHAGGYNAKNWVKYRLPNENMLEAITSIDGLVDIANHLAKPVALKIDYKGKYPSIIDASFEQEIKNVS